MRTKLSTLEEQKEIFVETLLDKTDKVTKVSPGSVLNGIAYGVAKLGQKALKDVAIIESHIFPDVASGSYLDQIALQYGVSARFGPLQSSGFLRVVGTPGTQYIAGTHNFFSSSGLRFELEADYTIPSVGFGYLKVRSQITGEQTNVEALSINRVTPIPAGHQYVINEYNFIGGRNAEDDDTFRTRIMDSPNIHATGTLSRLEQVFIKINPNILRIFHQGLTNEGKVLIGITTINGIDLTPSELNSLLLSAERYLSIRELRPRGSNSIGIELENIPYFPVDISLRLDIDPAFDILNIRREMQINMNKYFDPRFWRFDQKVEWDDLLEIAKRTNGVKYVYDVFFTPNQDIPVPKNQLPRVRGFLLLDVQGNLISDGGSSLNPIYYPNIADFSLQATILASL